MLATRARWQEVNPEFSSRDWYRGFCQSLPAVTGVTENGGVLLGRRNAPSEEWHAMQIPISHAGLP